MPVLAFVGYSLQIQFDNRGNKVGLPSALGHDTAVHHLSHLAALLVCVDQLSSNSVLMQHATSTACHLPGSDTKVAVPLSTCSCEYLNI